MRGLPRGGPGVTEGASGEPGQPTPHALREVAFFFLRLGFTAFGGPAAHIAMMEEEVVRRRSMATTPAGAITVTMAHLVATTASSIRPVTSACEARLLLFASALSILVRLAIGRLAVDQDCAGH